MNKKVSQLDETIKIVNLEGNEKLHLVGHVLNHTNDQLNQLSHDSNENFQKLKKTMDHFAQLSGGFDHRHCFSYRDHRQFSDSVTFAARIVNFTQVMQTLKAELVAYKIGLHNFGYILYDALNSLANGRLPATLVRPDALRKMLDGLRLNDWHESIPREEFMTYFNFELVSATVIYKQGLNVHLNIPVHHTSGYHQVYRAIPIPQPIGDGPTATRYRFDRTILLASKLRDSFAEISETKLHSHCRGSSRLKLCLKPFATSRSSASTCLSSLFSGLEVGALKLCPQEVIILPEEPIAEYLEDSTYLISSMKNTYEFFNYSDGGEKGEKIKGCRSCLVRPECGGRIENPSGSLVLYPDPRNCQYDAGFSLHVEPNWLIRTLFETLRKAELDVAPLRIPSASRGRAHQEILQAFIMNLAELPEKPMDELALEEITRPFAKTIVRQHVLPTKSVKAEASFAILMTMLGLTVLVMILCMLSRIFPAPFRRV